MKYVTIRLLVDDHHAASLECGLATTARGEGYIGINIEPDTLHGFDIEDQSAVDGVVAPAVHREAGSRCADCDQPHEGEPRYEAWAGLGWHTFQPRTATRSRSRPSR